MSALRLRASLRHSRRRLLAVLVVVMIAGAVEAHHGMPTDMHAMPAASMCLAVVAAGAVFALSAALAPLWRRSWIPFPAFVVPVGWPAPRPGHAARAGPRYLILQVFRR